MLLETNGVYHCYNQGNNRQPIFLHPGHYEKFLQKIKTHLKPSAHILAYCLMPNHFHFLLKVKPHGAKPLLIKKPNVIYSKENPHMQRISFELGKLLSSYTRSFNSERDRTGSLFRKGTHFKDTWQDTFQFKSQRKDNYSFKEHEDYIQTCFDYIHSNPVKAGLAKSLEEWPYSSYRELMLGDTRNNICSVNTVERMELI